MIYVLFTNATIVTPKPLKDLTDEEGHKTLDVNLTGYLRFCRVVLSYMMKPNSGSIICMSSNLGSILGFQGLEHYCASKGGVEGFIKCLALEAAPYKKM